MIVMALWACGGLQTGSLVDSDSWRGVDADTDPFDDRPGEVTCPEGEGWFVEELDGERTLSVDTGYCDYLAVSQPLLAPVSTRDELFMRLWHYDLDANAVAEAHAALWADGTVIWETRVGIPAESSMIAVSFTAPELEEGTELFFHLHNHGDNTWNLIELSKNPDL